MADAKPPVHAELVWSEGLQFAATSGKTAIVIDGDSTAGPSPVQLLVLGLAGCMAIDLVDIIHKGRHPLTACRATIAAERRPTPPRHVVKVDLRFHLQGDVPEAAAERAIMLSREKYCSVWHSLRPDIELTTAFSILP